MTHDPSIDNPADAAWGMFHGYTGPTDPVAIVEAAQDEHDPVATFILSSGGNDSMVLLDYLHDKIDYTAVVHVNTGTGVCEGGRFITTDFIRDFCAERGYPFIELMPPKSYEEVFITNPIIDGLPGPGLHHIAYNRLKERPICQLVKETKRHRRDRVLLLTGIRGAESRIRMGYVGNVTDRIGAQVWSNPIYFWSNEMMQAYRSERSLPQNPVAEHIHISGECLCGAFAKPGELDEIRFFFPETAARIEGWEATARAKGLTHCVWGQRRSDDPDDGGRLCSQCVGQMDLLGGVRDA